MLRVLHGALHFATECWLVATAGFFCTTNRAANESMDNESMDVVSLCFAPALNVWVPNG